LFLLNSTKLCDLVVPSGVQLINNVVVMSLIVYIVLVKSLFLPLFAKWNYTS